MSSSIQTTNIKRKVYAAINRGKKTLAITDTAFIGLVLVAIWISCTLILTIIDTNFNKDLDKMIRLRSGTQIMFNCQVDQFVSGILFFQDTLSRLSILDPVATQRSLFDPPNSQIRNLSREWTLNIRD